MKIIINEIMFEKMLNAVKSGCARNYASKPALEYIRIKAENGKITAMVCDGVSGARFTLNAMDCDGEDFTCLIKPISFKASKNGTLPVSIELVDNECLLDVPTAYGNLTYHFKQDWVWDDKLDKIFDKMKTHDREIGVNANLMARIMRNFASVSTRYPHGVVIESKDSKTEGFRMYAIEEDKFEFEQFLLPVRYDKKRSNR